MITFLTVIHVLVCVFLILVVLLQAGKGGGMGIAFGGGGGGSQTVFGSSGAGNFLTRLTSITAFIFLVTSLGLAHFSSQQDSKRLQRLAEKKTAEKKADDARAEKLKVDVEKARESVQKTVGGAAATTPAPAGSETSEPTAPAAPAKAESKPAPKGEKGGDKPAKGTRPAKGSDTEAAPAAATPRKHKRAAATTDGETAKPAEKSEAPKADKPAPAPAPAAE
jgi:preprotein translocase subunit SecG